MKPAFDFDKFEKLLSEPPTPAWQTNKFLVRATLEAVEYDKSPRSLADEVRDMRRGSAEWVW
jgi:hypothetical protein